VPGLVVVVAVLDDGAVCVVLAAVAAGEDGVLDTVSGAVRLEFGLTSRGTVGGPIDAAASAASPAL
jgi:hypothetical protein